MLSIDTKSPRRRLVISLIATLAAFCLLLVTTRGALADTVNISDKAGVLKTSQVQSEAAKLSYPVNIYTMNNFTGSESAFNQEAVRTLNDAHNPRLIVIAIDTHNKFLAIVGGKDGSTGSGVSNTAGGFSFLPLCLVGFLVLGLIVIAGMLFMRSARRRITPYPLGNPYQQPYNQGYP